jgi:hypothetical protein
MNSSLSHLYRRYKRSAGARGYDFTISKEEFTLLVSAPCRYCSTPHSGYTCKDKRKHKPVAYNGIDRIDNTQGYHTENVVTCCKVCNYAKREMTIEEFTGWIQQVYNQLVTKTTVTKDTTFLFALMENEKVLQPEI